MKNLGYLITVLLGMVFNPIISQHFEIPVYFEDSTGNKDTIVLGYDALASYEIDPAFGEINLIDSAYSMDFEVRAAIYDYGHEWGDLPRIIESNKMILGHVCYDSTYFDEANSIMVVIKSNHWPITMSWDKTKFQETCNNIDIIDCTPGGWFDVCGGGHPYSLLEMRLTDTASYYDTEFKIVTETDTLSALFFRFFNDFESAIENTSKEAFQLYPNPTNGLIHLNTELHSSNKIIIRDITGTVVPFAFYNHDVDISNLPDGVYILTMKLHNTEQVVFKIIKDGY